MSFFNKKDLNNSNNIPSDYERYNIVLNDDEILKCALLINEYKKGDINFSELKKKFQSIGIVMKPRLIDFSTKKMTVEQGKVVKERLDNENYIYNDINGFLLDIGDKKVIFYMDYKAIEVLANAGLPEYIKSLIGILEWEIKNMPNGEKKELLKEKRLLYLSKLNEYDNFNEHEENRVR